MKKLKCQQIYFTKKKVNCRSRFCLPHARGMHGIRKKSKQTVVHHEVNKKTKICKQNKPGMLEVDMEFPGCTINCGTAAAIATAP